MILLISRFFLNSEHLILRSFYLINHGSRLLCSIILKRMLSDVLIVVMWPKWVHKHLQEATKNVFSWKKLYIISWFYQQKIFYTDFEDGDFSCTGKFYYRHGNFHNTEAATGGALKIQIKVSQNSRKNTYASVSFLIKMQGLGLQLC